MDIQTRKIEFVQEFLKLKDQELIFRLEKLLRSEKRQKYENANPMSVEDLNERIGKSLEDSSNGRLTKSSELISEIGKWG